jgi:hypothetical protein
MSETTSERPNNPERRKRHVEILTGLFDSIAEECELAAQAGADVSYNPVDSFTHYCMFLAEEDRELGDLLVAQLEEKAPERYKEFPAVGKQMYELATYVHQAMFPTEPSPAPPTHPDESGGPSA